MIVAAILACLAFLLPPFWAHTQPNITRVEWYVDTDPGYGSGTPISLSAGPDISNLSFSVNLAPLSEGVHIAGVRSRDANGAWSIDNKWVFVKPYAINSGTPVPNINRVEWFVDTDPGYGNATSISISPGTDLNSLGFSLNFAALTEGVHIVGVRSRDANGSWSHDNKWLFVKPFAINNNTPVPNINRVEWFVDTDPGYGNATAIALSPAANITGLNFQVNIPAFEQGVHIVGVRSRDVNGTWSHDNKWLFVKPYSFSVLQTPNINKVEWYLDTDPGYGKATQVSVSPGTNLSGLSFSQSLGSLSAGIHIIGVRSQDANGAWSQDNKWLFLKSYGGQSARQVSQIEYYIDTDPGYGKGTPVALTPAVNVPNKDIVANISGLNAGKHYVFFRSKDNLQAWSFDYRDSFTVANPVAAPRVNINSVTKKFMCDKDSFNVGYDLTGSFNASNQFQVFVSNASGSFASEVLIGTVTATIDSNIRCLLPINLPVGNGYKLRVKSTNPVIVSDATPFSLNFYDRPHFNNDTTVQVVCGSDIFGPNAVWANTGGYTLNWTSLNANTADTGTFKVIAINNNGCSDTVSVKVTFEVAHWTGAISNDWHTEGNWDLNKVPTEKTHVIIEAGKPNNCLISLQDAVAASVQVKPGANLKATNNYILTIAGSCNALPK